jgi:hypothetical protein
MHQCGSRESVILGDGALEPGGLELGCEGLNQCSLLLEERSLLFSNNSLFVFHNSLFR